MRSASTALLVVLSLGVATGSSASAASPGGTPLPSGHRFEFPEHGVAVTMPAGWLNQWATPSLPIFEVVIAAAPLEGPGECVVETFAFKGAEPYKVAETLGVIGGYPEFEITEGVMGLDALPNGDPVVRMSAAYAPGGQPGASVAYVFPTPVGFAWLWCSTTGTAPADDWLSTAEGIEFLPEDE